MSTRATDKRYHHGDLAPTLRQAALAILEEEGLEALSLRSVARRAGVSHAAPYRHYPSREALLADVASEGLAHLRGELAQAAAIAGDRADRIVRIGGAYLRFASRHAGLLRLMFGSELPNRADFPGLAGATSLIGEDIVLTAVLNPAPRQVKVDAGQIEQIIMNVAVNARDAMPEGGRLSIETASTEFDGNDRGR